MTKPAARPLDRETVLAEAFALLAEAGLAGLSMRKLAERLSVQAPALYWHFTDKGELLGLMAAEIYREARESVGSCSNWRDWLLTYGRALRERLVSQRDAPQLLAIAPPTARAEPGSAEAIAAPLVKLGLDRAHALTAVASVTSLALGWGTFAANGPMHHYLEEMIDFDESFEAGLVALVKGL